MDDGYSADAYACTCCISALGKASGWESALQMFAEMRREGPAPSAVTCNAAMAALGKGQRWDLASELLQQMRQPGSGLPPADTVTFNTAAAVANEAQRWQCAVWLCTLLQLEGLQADAVTHNILVGSCKASSRWQVAVGLLSVQRPQIEAVTAAIDTLASCSLWEHAVFLLFNMALGLRPNVMTYGATMNALARGAAWQLALQLLHVMKEQTVPPNAVVCSCAISACDEAEEWTQSLALLEAMCRGGPAPNLITFNSAIIACTHARKWLTAVHLFRHLQRTCRPDAVSISCVLSAFELSPQWSKALAFLSGLRALGIETASASSAVFSMCGATGRWEQALGSCPWVDTGLVARNAAIAAVGEGHAWAASTELLVGLLQHGRPDSVTLGAMVSTCARAEEWPGALKIFSTLPRLRATVDLVCANAAASAPRKRCWQQTLQLLQCIPLRRLRGDVISTNTGLAALAQVSNWRLAMDLLAQAIDSGIRPTEITWNALSVACAGSSQWQLCCWLSLRSGVRDVVSLSPAAEACEKSREASGTLVALLEEMAATACLLCQPKPV
ncbi:unnamed protein product [Symbiodinium natans]|uniref:Pentatricopeptide repeat-containing protein, chloroplastic n=1 Tax=Symbiodinium natans TaxID=878477 RepID=A0A812M050_9DINO|nr:unnamed protein product [Symbiodinium natans]